MTTPQVFQKVSGGKVISMKFEVQDASELIEVREDGFVLQFPEGVDYEVFTEEYGDATEKLAELLGNSKSSHESLVDKWQSIYEDCNPRGKIVLRTIAEEGVEDMSGMKVEYADLENALDSGGYEVSPQTLAGVFRGVNASIASELSGMSAAGDAQEILHQEKTDDGEKYRVLHSMGDNENHPKALVDALTRLGIVG